MAKINIAELLKNCPKGMELYSPIYGLGILTRVTDRIYVKFPKEHNEKCFKHDGKVSEDGEIMLFPKGKTTWEGFHRPFKDGDVVCYLDSIAIFKEWGDSTLFRTYVTAYLHGDSTIDVAIPLFGKSIRREARLAYEEEKAKLFQAIKDNGYHWNAETKTLEKIKPRFKVGDKVKSIFNNNQYIITKLTNTHYTLVEVNNKFQYTEPISEDKNWKLTPQ